MSDVQLVGGCSKDYNTKRLKTKHLCRVVPLIDESQLKPEPQSSVAQSESASIQVSAPTLTADNPMEPERIVKKRRVVDETALRIRYVEAKASQWHPAFAVGYRGSYPPPHSARVYVNWNGLDDYWELDSFRYWEDIVEPELQARAMLRNFGSPCKKLIHAEKVGKHFFQRLPSGFGSWEDVRLNRGPPPDGGGLGPLTDEQLAKFYNHQCDCKCWDPCKPGWKDRPIHLSAYRLHLEQQFDKSERADQMLVLSEEWMGGKATRIKALLVDKAIGSEEEKVAAENELKLIVGKNKLSYKDMWEAARAAYELEEVTKSRPTRETQSQEFLTRLHAEWTSEREPKMKPGSRHEGWAYPSDLYSWTWVYGMQGRGVEFLQEYRKRLFEAGEEATSKWCLPHVNLGYREEKFQDKAWYEAHDKETLEPKADLLLQNEKLVY